LLESSPRKTLGMRRFDSFAELRLLRFLPGLGPFCPSSRTNGSFEKSSIDSTSSWKPSGPDLSLWPLAFGGCFPLLVHTLQNLWFAQQASTPLVVCAKFINTLCGLRKMHQRPLWFAQNAPTPLSTRPSGLHPMSQSPPSTPGAFPYRYEE
jgi:hypothetical protein